MSGFVETWIWLVLAPFLGARYLGQHALLFILVFGGALALLAGAALAGYVRAAGIAARVLGTAVLLVVAAWFAALAFATAALGIADGPSVAWSRGGVWGAFVSIDILLGALLWLWIGGRTVVLAATRLARSVRPADPSA